jgi:hypothetical protein
MPQAWSTAGDSSTATEPAPRPFRRHPRSSGCSPSSRGGYLGPESGRLSKLAADRSPDDPEYQRRIRRIFLISRIELLALILVVVDMTVKPGL